MEKMEKLFQLAERVDEELCKFPKDCQYNEALSDLYSSIYDIKYVLDDVKNNYTLVKKEKKFGEYQQVEYQEDFNTCWFKGVIENLNDEDNSYDVKSFTTGEIVKNVDVEHIR